MPRGDDTLGVKLAHEPGAFEVGVDDGIPVIFVDHGVGLGACLNTGVIDQHVNGPEGRLGRVKKSRHARPVADIEGCAMGLAAGLVDLAHTGVDLFQTPGAEAHFRAGFCQHPCKVVTKSGRCAGYRHVFVIQPEKIQRLPLPGSIQGIVSGLDGSGQ